MSSFYKGIAGDLHGGPCFWIPDTDGKGLSCRGQIKTGRNCWIKSGRDVGTKPVFHFPSFFSLANPGQTRSDALAPAQDRALRKRNLSGVGSPWVEWFSQRLQTFWSRFSSPLNPSQPGSQSDKLRGLGGGAPNGCLAAPMKRNNSLTGSEPSTSRKSWPPSTPANSTRPRPPSA